MVGEVSVFVIPSAARDLLTRLGTRPSKIPRCARDDDLRDSRPPVRPSARPPVRPHLPTVTRTARLPTRSDTTKSNVRLLVATFA